MKKILILFGIMISLFSFGQSRIKAEIYAQNTAKQIKDSYTPFTGKNVKSYIKEAEYDYTKDEYVIKMIASWDARGCPFCSMKEHRILGVLFYNPYTKKAKFKTLDKNSAVRKTESYIELRDFVIGSIIILDNIEN